MSQGTVREIPVAALKRGAYQPRGSIDDESIDALTRTVQRNGVVQPLLVRPSGVQGQFEIVAGERRWRAAQRAGLETVPALVRDLSDQEALALALVENLQRADLNAMEEARGLQRLVDEFGLTHAEVAERVGRSRAGVSNLIRLLELPDEIQALVASGSLSMGHARALLPLPAHAQLELAALAVNRRFSVRQVERQVAERLARDPEGFEGTPDHQRQVQSAQTESQWLGRVFSEELGRPVGVGIRKTGGRTLGLGFESLDQLHESLQKLESVVGRLRAAAGRRPKSQ